MIVQEPKQTPSGMWRTQVQINKKRISITEPTKQKCIDKAYLLKSQGRNGLLTLHKPKNITLSQAIDNYILVRSNVLSASTIAGYKEIQRNRFKSVMNSPIESVSNWTAVVNNEAKIVAPKTLKNAWSLVHSALKDAGIDDKKIKVSLPKIPKADRPWLQPEEIKVFLKSIEGDLCELPALLALHSLRRSEIFEVRKEDVVKGVIRVRGAMVRGENGFVHQQANKTDASSRDVPVMIARLTELIKEKGQGYLCTMNPATPYKHINKICEELGFPQVGYHGLRHSFASLCYRLRIPEMEAARLGGWDDLQTMHKIYTHLAAAERSESVLKITDFFA